MRCKWRGASSQPAGQLRRCAYCKATNRAIYDILRPQNLKVFDAAIRQGRVPPSLRSAKPSPETAAVRTASVKAGRARCLESPTLVNPPGHLLEGVGATPGVFDLVSGTHDHGTYSVTVVFEASASSLGGKDQPESDHRHWPDSGTSQNRVQAVRASAQHFRSNEPGRASGLLKCFRLRTRA